MRRAREAPSASLEGILLGLLGLSSPPPRLTDVELLRAARYPRGLPARLTRSEIGSTKESARSLYSGLSYFYPLARGTARFDE